MANQFIPFKDRGIWNDIEPIEQFEGGMAPIAPIHYQPRYKEVTGYFRAILKVNEVSERAFDLTKEVIMINAGNYAAWTYRRKLLDKLEKSLEEEFEWLNDIGIQFEKNYQIWHHRRCVAEMLGNKLDLEEEEEFLEEIFESEPKNYHAWTYRIWFVERFQLWKDELQFVDKQLDAIIDNNSIWSYRFFLLNRSPPGVLSKHQPGTKEFVEQEIDYTITRAFSTAKKDNEPAWVYLNGMLALSDEDEERSKGTNNKRVHIKHFVEKLLPWAKASLEEAEKCMPMSEDWSFRNALGLRFIQMLLVDIYLGTGEQSAAIPLMENLRDHSDKIRKNYWQWRINNLAK